VGSKFFSGRVIAFTCIALLTIFGLALWWRVNWLAYQKYVPADIEEKAVPLLVVLHGTGGDARTTREWLGFDEFAEEFGFITVYPHSPDGQWDAGAGILEHGTGERVSRDDTGYIVEIIEEVAGTHLFDREKVFVVGVSDGAAMAVRLSCELDGTFSGLASVAATIPVYAINNCDSAKPLSALFIHGKADNVIPWKGKSYRGITIYRSLEASVDWWLSRNGCELADGDRRYQHYAGQVDRQQIQNCEDNTEVLVYRVNDGGHAWPMRDHPQGRTQGHVNRDIDATALIVEWMNFGSE